MKRVEEYEHIIFNLFCTDQLKSCIGSQVLHSSILSFLDVDIILPVDFIASISYRLKVFKFLQ